MKRLDPITAELLLQKCSGDEIWSLDKCRSLGIPESWIDELSDTFESGFDHDRNTIYVPISESEPDKLRKTNQFHGVSDLQLAYRLAEFLGVDTAEATATAFGRTAEVRALTEAVDEL